MKKIICALIAVFLAAMYATRVYIVNINAVDTIPLKYSMGTEVAIEDDFFDSSIENMNGYSVTVIDASLITIDDFFFQYNETNRGKYEFQEYMLLVKVKFKNISNEYGSMAGIDLTQYILQERAYINFMNRDAYKLINGIDSLAFSLRLGTEKELIIPFSIDLEYLDVKQIQNHSPHLVITLFPHKKSIVLDLS